MEKNSSSPSGRLGLRNVLETVVGYELPSWVRYTGAVVITALGVAIAELLRHYTGFFAASVTVLTTVLATILGGFGPGILASIISSVVIDLYVTESLALGELKLLGLVRILVFAFVTMIVSFLVSSLRASLKEAEKTRAGALAASDEKDAVIAFVSHDLRGPLSSISLTFQLMQRYLDAGGKEREMRRLASNGVFFCQRMGHLIQNLLDASKIKAGGISLSPSPQDLYAIVEAVVSEHQILAEDRQLDFRLERDQAEPFPVNCDQTLMMQVISNIILNAFKFTPVGGVVSAKVEDRGEKIALVVKDSGVGIAVDQLPFIFEKFWQSTKSFGEGAGLGLFVSRSIVEAHGGEILVESELGRGTAFTVLMPKQGSASGGNAGTMANHVSLGGGFGKSA